MIKIYSPYNPPRFLHLSPCGSSITVQGLVTSLSVILNGGDDNNMKTLDLGYSETVRDLYPEMFGRPTKYELEYERQAAEAYAQEMGVKNDAPSQEPAAPSDPVATELTPEK